MEYKGTNIKIESVGLMKMYSDSIKSNYPKGNVIDIRVDYTKELQYPYIITYFISTED